MTVLYIYILYYIILYYIIFWLVFNTVGMSHLKIIGRWVVNYLVS